MTCSDMPPFGPARLTVSGDSDTTLIAAENRSARCVSSGTSVAPRAGIDSTTVGAVERSSVGVRTGCMVPRDGWIETLSRAAPPSSVRPPVTSTRPSAINVAVWPRRLSPVAPTDVAVRAVRSQISVATASGPPLSPPVTSTRPSVSSVAVWLARPAASPNDTSVNVPVAGLKTSGTSTSAPPFLPPRSSTVPSSSNVAVCPARA